MSWSFPIGRLFGSELRVHVTFFLLLAWIAIAGWQEGGAVTAAANTAFIVLLFACVIAHELGHALMARRFGIRTPDITLLPIGGLARLEKMPEKPAQEIAVALAGPAVNVVIFAVLALFLGGTALSDSGDMTTITFASLPARIAVLNLILALFNLLPAFPMDGGRILRALLAIFMDRVAATRAAARAGQVLAFVMGLAGLLSGNPMLLLIAFFIVVAAGAESSDVAMKTLARGLMARDAMITEYEALAPGDSLEAAAAALIRTTQHEFPVIDPASGRFMGMLTRAGLFAAMRDLPGTASVGEVMETGLPEARLCDGLEVVLERMQGKVPALVVLGDDGGLIGYVTRDNIGELMVLANTRNK